MRYLVATLAVALFLVPAVVSGGGHGHKSKKTHKVCCPSCKYVCEFSAEKDKEEKDCFKVKCKPICIPKITFPWQKKPAGANACCDAACDGGCDGGCDAACDGGCKSGCRGSGCRGSGCRSCGTKPCGKVRVVNVLIKHKYECQKCKYKWTPKKVRCGGCGTVNGCTCDG